MIILDVAGTGGSPNRKGNISTAVAFVTAACGIPTAKNCGRKRTSESGSFEVLMELGVPIHVLGDNARKSLDRYGIAFTKPHVSNEVDRLDAVLLNPLPVTHHLMGVGQDEWIDTLRSKLATFYPERKVAFIRGGRGGDDMELQGHNNIIDAKSGDVQAVLWGQSFFTEVYQHTLPIGGDTLVNAGIIISVLNGDKFTPNRWPILANAALAINFVTNCGHLSALQMAESAIDSGRALEMLLRARRGVMK